MSESNLTAVARSVLEERVKQLDSDIAWREENLTTTMSSIAQQRLNLDHLRKKRTALTDAIRIHFPVVTW